MIPDVPAIPTPAVVIGQGEYAIVRLVCLDLPPVHWWAKAIRKGVDWIGEL